MESDSNIVLFFSFSLQVCVVDSYFCDSSSYLVESASELVIASVEPIVERPS